MSKRVQACLWLNGGIEQAADYYLETFPDSSIRRSTKAPGDWPAGKAGDVITIEMTILGLPVMLLNGGPDEAPTNAVSLMVLTQDQAETDRYWNAIVDNGGEAIFCGWCKDRYGFSWQITPRRVNDYLAGGGEKAAKAWEAMMQMTKLDIDAIDAAVGA